MTDGHTLTRRGFLGATALFGLAACAAPTSTPAASTPAAASSAATGTAPAGPITSPQTLADWIGANPQHASIVVDDGRGVAFSHLAEQERPIASAVKVVHLTAYAQAVQAGRLDPAAPVTVADWERWYVAGADGGAHPAALQALGVDATGTVTWDDIVATMIDVSDNAAADLLTETLGVDALAAAAQAGGWSPYDPAFIAGEGLYVLSPATDADRRTTAEALGTGFAAGDPALRELAALYAAGAPGGGGIPAAFPVPGPTSAALGAAGTPGAGRASTAAGDTPEWTAAIDLWDGSWTATADRLAALHRAAATDALGPQVSATVRRHLERGLTGSLPAGVLGAGQKGGSLAGILSNAVTVRRDDGTVGVAVVSFSRLPQTVWTEAQSSGALIGLSQQVLLDDAVRDHLRTALGG